MAYAPSDVPGKGTKAGTQLCRRVIYSGYPDPIIPDRRAYAIRPYTSDSCFLSIWVGAYCIRPIRRPDKGTNVIFWLCCWVIDWGRPGPTVPDCGAYAVTPYASGFHFLSVRVGAYCIRPTCIPQG